MTRYNFFYLLLASALLSAPAHATTYSAESIRAQVVDADTNQPLEGVIVVAHWELERKVGLYGHSGTDPRGPLQLKVMETVTDHAGHFAFPAWGPLDAPPGAYLEWSDPAILMFKPGYEPYGMTNEHPSTFDPTVNSTRISQITGTTIKLKKFQGDLKAYADKLREMSISLKFATNYPHCDWKQIPRMLVAMDKQQRLFQESKILAYLPSIDRLPLQDQCGSAREFLKGYADYQESPPDNPPKVVPNKSRHAPQPQMMYGPPEGFIPPKSK